MQYDLRRVRIVQIFSLLEEMIVELADEKDERWLLELRGVVGFSYQRHSEGLLALHMDDMDSPPGAYAISLSVRLKRPELRNYPAVYLLKEPVCTEVVFSAVAQFVNWRMA